MDDIRHFHETLLEQYLDTDRVLMGDDLTFSEVLSNLKSLVAIFLVAHWLVKGNCTSCCI